MTDGITTSIPAQLHRGSPILVTGAAGFIGYHVCRRLLDDGAKVIAVDDLNDYYDVRLKEDRLSQLAGYPDFTFQRLDVADRDAMARLFESSDFDAVVHLAAQAGVRYSVDHPYVYLDSNLGGFVTVLEGCRQHGVRHLVFASSSSVYGANIKQPFSEHDPVDHPVSLYGATKRANELMAHAYAHLYGLPCTGLRFFTVYGPWGRPDMALFLFTEAILAGRPIDVYNYGRMRRDFTYIDDIVEGLVRVLVIPPTATVPDSDPQSAIRNSQLNDPASSSSPFRLYNIGHNQPVELMDLIGLLEKGLGKRAVLNRMPIQLGDVPATWADVDDLAAAVGYRPATPIETGIACFIEWYRDYYSCIRAAEKPAES